MSTKKTSRTVKSPAKEGTIPKEVIKAAVKATSPKPTIKSLQDELAIANTAFADQYVIAADLTKQVSDLKSKLVEQDNTPWTTITYQRFVRWLTNVTSYFKE